MIFDLVNNVALLLAACWIQSLISYRWQKDSLRAQVASGMLFAFATVTVMMMAILLQPGLWLWVDSSMVVISVSALLYGPVAGGIALVAGILYRLWMGGVGATAGAVGLVIALVGGLGYRLLIRRGSVGLGVVQLVVFGLLVNGLGALLLNYVFILSDQGAPAGYAVGVLLIMPAATVLLGLQLQYIERKKELERQIQANEQRLRSITQSIPDQLMVADTSGQLLDIITPAELAARKGELVGKNLHQLDPEAWRAHHQLLIAKAQESADGSSDIYSSNQRFLLDSESDTQVHYFESNAKKMIGSGDEGRILILTRDITERKQAEERIRFLAHYDPMTELPNRHLARETLDKAIARAAVSGGALALVMLHLDDLFIVNQSLGSGAGDHLVREIAKRLEQHKGHDNFLARYSGADFLLVVEGVVAADSVLDFCHTLLANIAAGVRYETHDLKIRASLGAALFPDHGTDANLLIRRATIANHHATESLENKCQLYHDQMDSELTDYIELRDRLSRGLQEDEFELYYQPYFALDSGQLRGVEAFLRWNVPELGIKSPAYFLETAEKSGLIIAIGDWVLQRVARQAREWQSAGLDFGTLAINISSAQLSQGKLAAKIRDIARELDLDPRMLTLEITESSINRDMGQTVAMAGELKAMGVGLSIDDFGTGFSNIQYLGQLAVDKLKIDGVFTRAIAEDDAKRDIVKAIIQIARSLGMATIAEGVEDEATRALLLAMGCSEAQGYLYTRPLPAEELRVFLQQRGHFQR